MGELGFDIDGYKNALGVYISFLVSKLSDLNNNLTAWKPDAQCPVHLFARQAVPMVWDFAEANPIGESSGSLLSMIKNLDRGFTTFTGISRCAGLSIQEDATNQAITSGKVVSTDPPYYDNIGYADLSDFFYIWLRRSLKKVYPELFSTIAVPKAEELVATPYRHGSKGKAETFFLDGMTMVMKHLAEQSHPAFPITIYYAFKQSESKGKSGIASTGWETFLDAVIEAGFSLTGTWPMRTEMKARQVAASTNALASSIALVCRRRTLDAPSVSRREFLSALKAELPMALAHLQAGNIAPVDLAQAAIGPGMAVFTRYSQVVDAEGQPLTVRAALALINQVLDEALAEQEGDFDADTRWALAWFEQSGFAEGEYGVAEQLSKSKNTAVGGLVDAGIIKSGRGKVRLLKPVELPDDWDPATDTRLTVWEMVHHLVRVLNKGETAAAELVAKLGSKTEVARELCYRLYTLCERKKRANEAMAYNALVQSWPEIQRLAREAPRAEATSTEDMFEQV